MVTKKGQALTADFQCAPPALRAARRPSAERKWPLSFVYPALSQSAARNAQVGLYQGWEVDYALMLERSERRAWRVATAGMVLGLIGIAAVFAQGPLRRVVEIPIVVVPGPTELLLPASHPQVWTSRRGGSTSTNRPTATFPGITSTRRPRSTSPRAVRSASRRGTPPNLTANPSWLYSLIVLYLASSETGISGHQAWEVRANHHPRAGTRTRTAPARFATGTGRRGVTTSDRRLPFAHVEG